tara:strand:+ start:439 stop:717 length:279 start_codon:yes stop_codon:yes gene_type:complete
MKKYEDYLKDKHEPMTEQQIRDAEVEFYDALYSNQETAKQIVEYLIAEIDYLRSMYAEAYWWIGRQAPRGQSIQKVYRNLMKEAHRIKEELR